MIEKKKRVLHLIDSGGMYGAENVIINLSREMTKSGLYDPLVGCIVQKADDEVDLDGVARQRGIEAYRIVINNLFLLRDLPRFAGLLKDLRIDLVHSHGYKASVFAFVALLFSGIPVMATCHLWFESKGRPLKMKVMIALEKFIYRFLPVVVCVSEDIRTILVNAGVSPGKIRVVQNGIVVSDYTELIPQIRQRLTAELGLQQGDVCILSVGRLTEQKAQCDLISAAKDVKKHNKKIKTFIAGEGELRHRLQQQISALALDDTVKLLGFRDDIPHLLQLADLFVLPSLDEGMPMALLEAVASKVPVITTAVGDIPKLIVHDVSGIVVEKNDARGLGEEILKLIEDRQRQNELVGKALQQVRELYSSRVMFRQYDEVYRGIFAGESCAAVGEEHGA